VEEDFDKACELVVALASEEAKPTQSPEN